MKKKNMIYIVGIIFIFAVMISVMVVSPKTNEIEVNEEYDSSYYVEGNRNVFVKFANLCDDCCYYVIDLVLGGVEEIFSVFIGN